eukprot:gnl/Trimastix_PCT/1351.p1 GENE.gnl/Trimastix_PCT/1351~~gnl/Trimastix_PCT/1351.p1  ORF type:complete len:395 (-),score=61.16 gnl/Trimastix_PCT/1351:194-1378(-)
MSTASRDLSDMPEGNVEEIIEILEDHMRRCEKAGEYIQAEISRNKLHTLRKQEEQRQREVLRDRQRSERTELEEANGTMLEHFNLMWEKEIQQFEEHAKQMEETMKERNRVEYASFQRTLLTETRHNPKFSRDLLNLRKIQETLAKQRDYAEAHKIKLKADSMEEWEICKIREQEAQRIENRLRQFKRQQQQELVALRKRLQREREEMLNQRASDAERLNRRFRNVQRELDLQQKMEKLYVEKQCVASTGGVKRLMDSRQSPRTTLSMDPAKLRRSLDRGSPAARSPEGLGGGSVGLAGLSPPSPMRHHPTSPLLFGGKASPRGSPKARGSPKTTLSSGGKRSVLRTTGGTGGSVRGVTGTPKTPRGKNGGRKASQSAVNSPRTAGRPVSASTS